MNSFKELFKAIIVDLKRDDENIGLIFSDENISNEISDDLGLPHYSIDNASLLFVFSNTKKNEKDFVIKNIERFISGSAQRMILFVHASLVRTGTKRCQEIREYLVNLNSNYLETSILISYNQKFYGILILNKKQEKNILFINGKDIHFKKRQVLENFHSLFTNYICLEKNIDYRDVILNNQLIIESFNDDSEVKFGVCTRKEYHLSDCANVITSPIFDTMWQKKSKDEIISLQCLSSRYFSNFGYTNPKKTENKWYLKKNLNEKHILRPNDIVFVSLRNIGKTTIIDPDFIGEDIVSSNMTFIIRAKTIDPRILYMFLNSDIVLDYWKNCSLNENTPRVSISSLKNLPIPDFTNDEKTKIIENFKSIEENKQKLNLLTENGKEYFKNFYS